MKLVVLAGSGCACLRSGVIFTNLPALDAQTRLLTGRYLEYRSREDLTPAARGGRRCGVGRPLEHTLVGPRGACGAGRDGFDEDSGRETAAPGPGVYGPP